MRAIAERLGTFLRRTTIWLGVLLLVVFANLILIAPVSAGQSIENLSPVVRVLLIVVLDALFLMLLYFQIRPEPKLPETGLVVRTQGARTELSIPSARERILKAVNGLPDIASTEVNLKAVQGRADVELEVVVKDDSINVPEKQKEIDRALQQVINKQLGLRMAGRPRVHIRFYEKEVPPPVVAQPLPEMPHAPVVKPEPPIIEPVKPEVEDKPRAGLFGGLLRGHRDEETPPSVEKPPEKEAKPEPEPVMPASETKISEDKKDEEWEKFAGVLGSLESKPDGTPSNAGDENKDSETQDLDKKFDSET